MADNQFCRRPTVIEIAMLIAFVGVVGCFLMGHFERVKIAEYDDQHAVALDTYGYRFVDLDQSAVPSVSGYAQVVYDITTRELPPIVNIPKFDYRDMFYGMWAPPLDAKSSWQWGVAVEDAFFASDGQREHTVYTIHALNSITYGPMLCTTIIPSVDSLAVHIAICDIDLDGTVDMVNHSALISLLYDAGIRIPNIKSPRRQWQAAFDQALTTIVGKYVEAYPSAQLQLDS